MDCLLIEGLSKTYVSPEGERQPVLDIERFALARGEQVALRGGSGSGKTTFLNLIAGILRPDAGRILLAGADMAALSESARDAHRARHLGYVFQTFHLLEGYSALENVLLGMAFGPGADRARAEELLVRVGLGHRLRHKPRQLSVGQQQRVAVARALASRPDLVLADEPTGNLDAARAQEALALIRECCAEAGAALLLVSHDPAVLAHFQRVEELDTLNRVGRAAAGGAA